ncbi:hypothetical protein Bca52824_044016 [Brassica carinata]|uniref:Uncharacterized protein n=1 Tax=Brassica carinata TaxID=52824 RepID=A0A8X7V080_BRACI|nr:hypothetical protein Bca52824_044016 [Brassica carinata]
MVAISEINPTVEATAANCLMLLSRVGQNGADQKRFSHVKRFERVSFVSSVGRSPRVTRNLIITMRV